MTRRDAPSMTPIPTFSTATESVSFQPRSGDQCPTCAHFKPCRNRFCLCGGKTFTCHLDLSIKKNRRHCPKYERAKNK